jgi:hypothetical protein
MAGDYPKIQIVTIEQLLRGEGVHMPPNFTTFKQAERVKQDSGDVNLPLFGEE